MNNNPYASFPGVTFEEISFLRQMTTGLTESQNQTFLNLYYGRRKSPQDILIFTLIGFIGIAGVQRFVVGQIGMGIIYVFTGGFCLIGTIIDLINHKSLANEYNQKMAYESIEIARMGV
ncbi:TM2 domain-containing protein [Mucilaginibacter ginkgonis]|uniref:TM2 domain-containing protein n=1 Tax=Mucilaginibacter ginkgonis TaxID=2682091 RepID=A0A6I4HZ02_9SPHI|nr:TM2 domain-containing protein [Mucilaginibacter ginkgonis]QQL49319.1 TM2 domain-containing protein [Mucilaginibacter ginkgonis]